MTIKTYFASSIKTIVAVMPNGKSARVPFEEVRGGSQFTTNDEELQNAIERNSEFNKGFRLVQTITKDDNETETETQTEGAPVEQQDSVIQVCSISEARDYLAENFDYTRSNLRSKTAIMEAGKAHNIIFEGI